MSGKVKSIVDDSTVVVSVLKYKKHKKYKKFFKRVKSYSVDSSSFEVSVDDNVQIVETSPISKNKKFSILEIV